MSDTRNLFEDALVSQLAERLGKRLHLTLTDNTRTMITVRSSGGKLYVRLSRIFALASQELTEDLIDFVTGKSKALSNNLKIFLDTTPLHPEARRVNRQKLKTAGTYFNLRSIASDINRKYFDPPVKARLTWGRSRRSKPSRRRHSIQYGSYDEHADLIRINPVLDSSVVPTEFIELVVYHEMLHKKLGFDRNSNGRRSLHPPEFRRMEREYERYEFAVEWERKNFPELIRMAKLSAPKTSRPPVNLWP